MRKICIIVDRLASNPYISVACENFNAICTLQCPIPTRSGNICFLFFFSPKCISGHALIILDHGARIFCLDGQIVTLSLNILYHVMCKHTYI